MAAGERDIERLTALLDVARLVATGVRGTELHAAVARTVARVFGYEVVLNLYRPQHRDFECAVVEASENVREALLGSITTSNGWNRLLHPEFEREGCYFVPAGALDWSTEEAAFVPDREPPAREHAWHPEDALFVALRHSDGHLLGVLSLDEPEDGMRPTGSDMTVLSGLGAHFAQALESAAAHQERDRLLQEMYRQSEILEQTVHRRTREVELARIETLQRLTFAIEFRDDETHQHTERVGRMAAALAIGIAMDDGFVELIRRAGPLHDIGKVGVSDTILLKPGRLDPAERRMMERHTTIGAQILQGSQSQVLRMGEEIALTHHERWDGGGYPLGLSGEEIPLSGRIVAIADVFDALMHRRPYKPAWPLDRAVAEIGRHGGSQFDPRLVEAFLRLDHTRFVDVRRQKLALGVAAARSSQVIRPIGNPPRSARSPEYPTPAR